MAEDRYFVDPRNGRRIKLPDRERELLELLGRDETRPWLMVTTGPGDVPVSDVTHRWRVLVGETPEVVVAAFLEMERRTVDGEDTRVWLSKAGFNWDALAIAMDQGDPDRQGATTP